MDWLNTNGPLVALWVVCGFLTATIASGRGRSFGGWFVAGILLGPLGIIAALFFATRTPEAEAKRLEQVEAERLRLRDQA